MFRRDGPEGAAGLEDEALVDAHKNGDRAAFEVLLTRYERPLFVFCLRSLGDRAAAEDACQETFIRAVRSLERWDGRAKFRTWLYTIARNHCVDELRKRRHRQTESLDRASDPSEAPPIERVPGPDGVRPDRVHQRRALGRVLQEGLDRLPPEQREVFLLREHAGLPFRAIAEMTETPENTVKSRMRYALQSLRTHLEAAGWGRGGGEP